MNSSIIAAEKWGYSECRWKHQRTEGKKPDRSEI